MKLIHNALSDDLHQKCVEEIDSNLKKQVWGSSALNWNPQLLEGLSGSCMATGPSDDLKTELEEWLKPQLPPYSELVIQLYVWQPNSGIAIHNDGGHNFGATVYLNEVWHPNAGGWFIWKDKETEEWKTILPEKNLMVVNDTREYHLVTSLSSFASPFRLTLQIWGDPRPEPYKPSLVTK